MVVKEKRGRRRYIAFEVTSEELISTEALLSTIARLTPKGKRPPKLIQFDGHVGVLRCDLHETEPTREMVVKAGVALGASVRTVSTSGTLRALRGRLGLPEGERRGRRG